MPTKKQKPAKLIEPTKAEFMSVLRKVVRKRQTK